MELLKKILRPGLKVARRAWHTGLSALWFVLVPPVLRRLRRHNPRAVPVVVFGPIPMINSKYHTAALREHGFEARSVVRRYYDSINRQDDYDTVYGMRPGPVRWVEDYLVLLKLALRCDVFYVYFNGFFLRGSPLRYIEPRVLKRIGCKVVTMHYGADVTAIDAVVDVNRKFVTASEYPQSPHQTRTVRRQIECFTRDADAIIGGDVVGPDHLNRIDYLVSSPFAIDERLWSCDESPIRHPDDPMLVLHAPNHRLIKGTSFVEEAVATLNAEGRCVELVLLERVQNHVLREVMKNCHVVVDQLVMGWYAMMALEGMSMGKPVLCHLRPDLLQLHSRYSFAGDLPIVNCSPEDVVDRLRDLYDDPERARAIGDDGRRFVNAYHSLEGMGGFLAGVTRSVWDGSAFDADAYWESRAALL